MTFTHWFEYFQRSSIHDGTYSIGEEAWNAAKADDTPPNPQHGREPGKAGVMQVCNSCVYQNKAVVGSCCSPIDCKYTAEPDFSKSIDPSMLDAPPDKMKPKEPKPLAQYLDEYIDHEVELGHLGQDIADMYFSAYDSWRELLEQALDAYQSTENVTIRIERV